MEHLEAKRWPRVYGRCAVIPGGMAIAAQVLGAPSLLTAKEILHRDLCPENMLFTAAGQFSTRPAKLSWHHWLRAHLQ
jgi:hypothetical protein